MKYTPFIGASQAQTNFHIALYGVYPYNCRKGGVIHVSRKTNQKSS